MKSPPLTVLKNHVYQNHQRQQMYDLQIENTHNFVAGHYVNTRTGKALRQPEEKAIQKNW